MENIIYSWTTVLISTVHAAGTAMDSSDTTVIFGTVGGLVGLLLLIMASAVILGVCIRLCICRKRQKYKATGMSYNTVSVLWSKGIVQKFMQCVKVHALILCITSICTMYVCYHYICVLCFCCFLHDITTDCDVVEMVSMQENPAYEDVHVSKKNYYSPHMGVI